MGQLYKDPKNGIIAGVCAGIAEWAGLPVGLVRVATILSFFVSFSLTFWVYILLAVFLPVKP